MGREIRRVPKGWEHPKYENHYRGTEYHPLHDEYYHTALMEWFEGYQLWQKGEHPHQEDYPYHEYAGSAPDPEYYRHVNWTQEEASCFQIYEDVSEGTPLSPVFDTIQELENWLVENEGYSREQANSFCNSGWAPSFIIHNGVITDGIGKIK